MKSLLRAGQAKLRGKKSKLMRCGCCVCHDLREGIINREIAKEIRFADIQCTEASFDNATAMLEWLNGE